MSPYVYDPEHLRVSKQQARSIQRVQTTMATIMIAAFAIVFLLLFARGCDDEFRGGPSDGYATRVQQ
jgi:hypothetical protein